MTGRDPTALAPRVRVDVLLDEHEHRSALRDATSKGLCETPKQVPAVWLYDQIGSRLFDQITRLPEYYPTRRERQILVAHAAEIAALTGAETLVELGSGTSEKTRLLLDALAAQGSLRCFVPLDVSEEVLVSSAHAVADEYPALEVHAVVGDFERHLSALPDRGPQLVAFLGSTIGNLAPAARARFLRSVASALGTDDALLVGLDLVKEPERITSAYNDGAGVTERFIRNALTVLNRELDADFSQTHFDYVAVWDATNEWVDIGFRSREAQTVQVRGLDLEVAFAEDEPLRVNVSSKFRRERIEPELAEAGLALARWWTDPRGDFALALASTAERAK